MSFWAAAKNPECPLRTTSAMNLISPAKYNHIIPQHLTDSPAKDGIIVLTLPDECYILVATRIPSR
jgi:hypothetical protein